MEKEIIKDCSKDLKELISFLTEMPLEILTKESVKNIFQFENSLSLSRKKLLKLKNLKKFINIYNETIFLQETMQLNSSKKCGEYLSKLQLNNTEKEYFTIVLLNSQNEIIDKKVLFEGTLTETAIHVREIIKHVLNYNTCSVIICHNHPANSLKPSESDLVITRKIKRALETIQVKLMDHIITTADGQYYSFAENSIELL